MYQRGYKRKMMKDWRARKKNHLEILRTKANAENATIRVISEYTKVCNKRKAFLQKEKERVKLYREKRKRKYSQYDYAPLKQQQNEDRVANKHYFKVKVKK